MAGVAASEFTWYWAKRAGSVPAGASPWARRTAGVRYWVYLVLSEEGRVCAGRGQPLGQEDGRGQLLSLPGIERRGHAGSVPAGASPWARRMAEVSYWVYLVVSEEGRVCAGRGQPLGQKNSSLGSSVGRETYKKVTFFQWVMIRWRVGNISDYFETPIYELKYGSVSFKHCHSSIFYWSHRNRSCKKG